MNTHSSLLPPSLIQFLKEGNEISNNKKKRWVIGGIFEKQSVV